MRFDPHKCTKLATFTGAALLCGVTAVAQSAAGPMQPQPPRSQPNQPTMNQMGQDSTTTTNGQASPADKMFVKKALQGGMAEVQLGQLALQKSSNDDVKQFAQKMIDDHAKMGDQMKPIAQQIGVPVPDEPSKKDQAVITRLQALSGDAFDKAYMKDMVKDHKMDLSDFKTEASSGSDPAVKSAAAQGSQIISQHLQMAEQINQKQGAMASNGGGK